MKSSVFVKLISLLLTACLMAACVTSCTSKAGGVTPTAVTVIPADYTPGNDATPDPSGKTQALATEVPGTGPLAGMIICVDAGTAGKTTGAAEYEINLRIALKLQAALEAQGATVVMVRTDNESSISNKERALMANEAHCELTFNIHCNGSESESANGTELYVRGAGDNTSEYSARSAKDYELGVKLLDRITASAGSKKRSVNKSDAYTGINWRDHTTFIVECGFMSNPDEDRLLSDPEYQDKIVAGIVAFVLEDYRNE